MNAPFDTVKFERKLNAPDLSEEDRNGTELTEDALAKQFSAEYGDRFLYVHERGKWYRYEQYRHKLDVTGQVFDSIRSVVREATEDLEKNKRDRKKVRSAATIAALEKIARSDPTHATSLEELDANLWLLNTPDGVVDLKTGKVKPNSPSHRCTMSTAVAPGVSAPNWLRTLREWMNDDEELVAYLQRLAGYALTGSTQEHALVFLYGPGGNGKSLFLGALAGCMGDYAITAPINTFTESKHDQHPTDLARLRGARLVITTETEANRRWADAKVKLLTGGDRITARFMHQDYFEFTPQFKLIVAGNHRPHFANVDDAIRRRLHIVPFTFKPAAPNPQLSATLRAEWPGILAWMIEGCVEWQRQGLNPPAAVLAATNEFFTSEDTLGAWLNECVEDDASKGVGLFLSAAFTSWERWAQVLGENARSSRWLSAELERRGFVKKHTNKGPAFVGRKLAPIDSTNLGGTPPAGGSAKKVIE